MGSGWILLADRGGTFTDVVATAPDGTRHVVKVLSSGPGGDPIIRALRELSGRHDVRGLATEIRLGTTLATNALLERKAEPTALAVTMGFGDLLEIGTQQRPEIFALRIEKPAPLHLLSVEIDERVLADGGVRRAPDPEQVRAALRVARDAGATSLAIALAHSFAHPEHERLVARIASQEGFACVVLSSEVARGPGLLARAETAVLDAALTPLLARHLLALREAVGETTLLRVMQSSGRLVAAESLRGRDAVLSGPAAGVIAVAEIARAAGLPRVIGFDMGGTSTDVSRWSEVEGLERIAERDVSGLRLRAPMLDIVTVAAGGGSILSRIGGRLVVGPESAGADPGPAGYRRGGPPTVTDANAILGRIQPALLPRRFGATGDQPFDVEASRAALRPLAAELGLSLEATAAGALRIANEAMAQAIRQVSIAKGRDPREHSLLSFGGAGAQHACALAESLGIPEILIHPLSGVLSALGMGLAEEGRPRVLSILAPLDDASLARARGACAAIEAEERERLEAEGFASGALGVERALCLRHVGVEAEIDIPLRDDATAATVADAFHHAHVRLFGFARAGQPIEIAGARVDVSGRRERDVPASPAHATEPARARERMGDWPVFDRAALLAGHEVEGPALIAEAISTIVVEASWRARVDDTGILRLARAAVASKPRAAPVGSLERDPIRLELFGGLFMGIAEQMGETLRRTSLSPNIKERLDYSCALFTADGALVANAPHVPVHLGAMGETVKALLASRGVDGMRPGMALVSNDPFHGGSHLPDITVVSPVFHDGRLAFFVANRGHHADVGGIVPGSMPPHSKSIDEEGVRLHDIVLVEDGRLREAEITALLAAGPHPVRGIPERLADLAAQVAANAVGARLLGEIVAEHGIDVVHATMRHVRDDAAEAVRELLATLPRGTHRFADAMDGDGPDAGPRIEVAITIEEGRAIFDFAGTSPQHAGNLNAPRAITVAAVLFVMRSLVGRRIPLNAGCLEPLEVRIPEGTLLSPRPPAAVAGGNVETSMRIADVLLGALGALAASQGTMNNLTFGDEGFGFYETICRGAGAGPSFAGASAVHSHLTNTRITDVEVLERRHPVLVREFSVRRGSGGAGRFRGGDGVVREILFLRPMRAAILSERRVIAPFGLAGGDAGARGRNLLIRADGTTHDVGGRAAVNVNVGDALRIESPGGGGFGDPA